MNKQLKEKTQKLVMENHKHFAMESWTSGFGNQDTVVELETMQQGCGTTGCLAAWTCIAAGVKLYDGRCTDPECTEHVEEAACELLDCDNDVFHVRNWSGYLQEEYEEAERNRNTLRMAEIACEALDIAEQLEDEGRMNDE